MPPTPTPEASEIETARKMCGVSSFADVEARINSLGDAQWADALLDIAEYDGARGKDVRVGGKVDVNPDRKRARLRREMRVRLGYSAWTDEEMPGSQAVAVSVSY